jgi:hypothetical protein
MNTSFHPTLVRRLVAGAILLAGLVLATSPARAESVTPTRELVNPDGSLAGFATSEPSLYFLVPSRWAPLAGGHTPAVRLTSAGSAGGEALYDLRLVLSPDYTRATPTVVALRQQDARSLFFPLPMALEQVTLFLPAGLGSVQAELVPDEDAMSTPVAFYYRLRFTASQLAVLRQLAHGGLTLTGSVDFSYPAPGGAGETGSPLTIILSDADLALSSDPTPDPTAWLADLLSTTMMSLRGVLDGPYPLGAGIVVQISNSRVDGWFVPSSWVLSVGADAVVHLAPTRSENLAGRVVFDVAQLGSTIRIDYQATMSAALDLSFMRLTIGQLDVTRVTVNGSPSAFYTALLKKLMTNPGVRARVSQALSDELQRRILAETLFGLGGVLP